MKRLVGTAIGLGVIALLICIPAVFYGKGTVTPTFEDTTITNYVANFDVAENGDMDVTETITVDFPGYGKHGIFRFWDIVDDNSPHARRTPEGISVTRDGSNEPFELSWEDHHRQRVAKIGSADTTLDVGQHIYVIKYHIDGVLAENVKRITGEDVDTMFYWQLIPRGWQQTIEQSTLTVHLPVPAQADVKCAIGNDSETGCTAEGGGTTDLTVTTGPIADRTPVTIATGLDMETPPQGNSVPWTGRWDRVLSTHLPLLIFVLLAAAGALAFGSILGAKSREKPPGFPVLYEPPAGIGPAQGKYIYSETVDRTTYVATLMHAAERGAIDLTRGQNDSWTITDKAGPAGWAGLDPVTTDIAHILGGPGSSFTAQKKDVSAGLRLKSEVERFDSSVETWAKTSGNMISSGLGGLGGLLVLAGFGLMLAGIIWNPFSMTALGADPRCLRHRRRLADGDRFRHQPDPRRSGPVVAGRWLPPDAGHAVEQAAVRLLRPQGALHRLHPVGGGARLRRRVGGQVPRRGRRGAAGAALLRRGVRRHERRCLRELDGRRLRQHRERGDLVVQRHPELVLERWRWRRLLRRRRRRRRRWRVVVTSPRASQRPY